MAKASSGRLRDAVQDPHVVDPGDMVGMRVGKQHRIRPRDAVGQKLGSHIRRCIDQKSLITRIFYHDAGPGPPVAWLRRIAGAPIAGAIRRHRSSAPPPSRRCRATSPACGLRKQPPEIGGGEVSQSLRRHAPQPRRALLPCAPRTPVHSAYRASAPAPDRANRSPPANDPTECRARSP